MYGVVFESIGFMCVLGYESERTSVTPVQQLSPALKKMRDMDEAIPRRARMAICKDAEFFMLGDVV